jgi:hypothetical protein
VGAADAEVVESAAVAQGEFAELVDGVAADMDVFVGCDGRRGGFGSRGGGLCWCGAGVMGAVGAFGVVDVDEAIEEGLSVGEGGRSGAWGQPAFEGLMEALDLALGFRGVRSFE